MTEEVKRMKTNAKILAIIIAVAMVAALTFPALAGDSETNGITLINQYDGGKYNQSFDKDAYHNTQGNIEYPLPGITAVPKDDDGHGHTWTIVADDSVQAGTIITIAVQTQGNNYVAYVLRVDGPGEFRFPHDVSLGRGYALVSSFVEPDPDPEPLVGMLEITKAFEGIDEEDVDIEYTFIVEGPGDYRAEIVLPVEGTWYWCDDELEQGDYTVTEAIGSAGMNIGDYEFVNVTVNGNESNTVTLNLTENGGLVKKAAFVNYYELPEEPPVVPLMGSLTVTKDVTGDLNKETADKSFSFTVDGVDVEYHAEFSLPNEDGTWSWSAGELELGTYTVKEDTDSAKISGYDLSVTGNGEASITLNAEQTDKTVDIVNDYSVPTPPTREDPLLRTTPTPREPDPTPDPVVEETMDIIEEDPPLAEFEPEEEVLAEEEFVIAEEPVPLAEMPQTGIHDSVVFWIFALCAAIIGVGVLVVITLKAGNKND